MFSVLELMASKTCLIIRGIMPDYTVICSATYPSMVCVFPEDV